MNESKPITCPVCRAVIDPKTTVSDDKAAWTPTMVDSLAKTQPWVHFLAGLGFLFGCLAGLAVVGYAIYGLTVILDGGPLRGDRFVFAATVLIFRRRTLRARGHEVAARIS